MRVSRRAPLGARATAVRIGLVCAAVLLAGPAGAQVYVLEEIPTQTSRYSIAYRINNAGQVTGTFETGEGSKRAFLWQNGILHDLGTLGGSLSEPTGINNRGEVVGSSQVNPPTSANRWLQRAFLWSDGAIQDLGTLGGRSSDANAINDAGWIVGSADTADTCALGQTIRRAFLRADGAMRDLGALGGIHSEAHDVNNAGQVVGEAGTPDAEYHAFLWQSGTMRDLGALGGEWSSALAINDAGLVLGKAKTADGVYRHFLWRDGAVHVIETPEGSEIDARTINNRGQVLGTLYSRRGYASFVLYSESEGFFDLRRRILPSPGWDPEALFDMNDAGEIVGCAQHRGQTRAIRLRPLLGGRLEAPERVTFAARPAGKPRVQTFRIRNVGTEPLAGRVGVLTAPYAVISGAGEYLLQPGKSRQIRVRLTLRSNEEAIPAALSITTSDPATPRVTIPLENDAPPLTATR